MADTFSNVFILLYGLLEVADTPPKALTDLWQLASTKNDENYNQNYQQLRHPQPEHPLFLSYVKDLLYVSDRL